MKTSKLIAAARKAVKDQCVWMDGCGGDLAGYIAKYGDPGVPPLDEQGQPKMVKLTGEQAVGISDLLPVPDRPGYYFFTHVGDGGTLIYQADLARLDQLKKELRKLQEKYPHY